MPIPKLPKRAAEPVEAEVEEETAPAPKEKYVYIAKVEKPKQDVNSVRLEDGSIGIIFTMEEAITQLLNDVAELKKGLL